MALLRKKNPTHRSKYQLANDRRQAYLNRPYVAKRRDFRTPRQRKIEVLIQAIKFTSWPTAA